MSFDVKETIEKMKLDAKVLEFEETVDSVETACRAASARPSEIVKTLVVEADGEPAVALVPGDRRLDSRRLKEVLGARDVKLAFRARLRELVGLEAGEVTPLAPSIYSLKCVVDSSILERERIIVGGGTHHRLVEISVRDLLKLLKGHIAAEISKVG
ncbi:MAG: YbaK/EbsC family protein [Candidatus Verstraetearchaeota archaeon]|nr:YbaK/EbsC family protein [Candidatus Verstraetearchaeota archaeon]